MKSYISKMVLLTLVAMSAMACEKNEQPQGYEKEAPEKAFLVRYAVPLSTGRQDIGETEIVDASHAQATNVAELRPAMQLVVEAALAGKLANYPDMDDPATSKDAHFIQKQMEKMASKSDAVETSELLTGLEMDFDGLASNGHTTLKPKFIYITFIDKDTLLPDMLMCKIKAEDLMDTPVKVGQSTMPLPQYLARLQYERYLIHFTSEDEEFGIRTFADARTVMQKVESGIVDNIAPPLPHEQQ